MFTKTIRMHLRTLLNHAENHKGFVFENDRLSDDGRTIEVDIRPRVGNRGRCAKCGTAAAGYDRLSLRRFQHIPFGPFSMIFLYEMRRVSCPVHGVTVEQVPWANGKSGLTVRLSWFLARWAKRLSWQEVAQVFEVNWRQVYLAVKMAVDYGLKNRSTDGVRALGVDEMQCGKGHEYMTLVYEMGDGVKRLTPSEARNKPVARKSLVASQTIKSGEVFSTQNITTKRPGTGISPMRWDEVIGQVAQKNYQEDDLI